MEIESPIIIASENLFVTAIFIESSTNTMSSIPNVTLTIILSLTTAASSRLALGCSLILSPIKTESLNLRVIFQVATSSTITVS